MELRGTLRTLSGGAPEPVTVLQLSDAGCTVESSTPLDLGARVEVEVEVEGATTTGTGVVMSSNELQLIYGIRFEARRKGQRAAAGRTPIEDGRDRAGD